jgi:hypothetical protein
VNYLGVRVALHHISSGITLVLVFIFIFTFVFVLIFFYVFIFIFILVISILVLVLVLVFILITVVAIVIQVVNFILRFSIIYPVIFKACHLFHQFLQFHSLCYPPR